MSGGGNKGAYEAGVVYGLTHLLPAEEVRWDVISGVSAGALNGAGISVWPVDEPQQMSEWLVETWMNMTSEKIYKSWPLGILEGIFAESGAYDDSPLLDLVTNILNRAGKIFRKFVFSSIDANTGNYITFSEANSAFEELPEKVISSSSLAFIFPHRVIGNMTLMDGGTGWDSNMDSAIERCREIVGNDDASITVDIILSEGSNIETITDTSNTINNYLRYINIKLYN